MKINDLHVIHGSVHDQAGPISTLHPATNKGRKWLKVVMEADFKGGFNPIIETEHAALVIDCAERDGLKVLEIHA